MPIAAHLSEGNRALLRRIGTMRRFIRPASHLARRPLRAKVLETTTWPYVVLLMLLCYSAFAAFTLWSLFR